MKCPYCIVEIQENFENHWLGDNPADEKNSFGINYMYCPYKKCKKLIIKLSEGETQYTANYIGYSDDFDLGIIYPLSTNRSPAPPEVDEKFAKDYREAAAVLDISANASAALSRRCLQNVLREKADLEKHSNNLNTEIQAVLDSGKLPSYLSQSLDAIRNIGNFAAHPNKSKATGEIVDVEPGEAEWSLELLEQLFDFYFVQPAKAQEQLSKLNSKLAEIGKPPTK